MQPSAKVIADSISPEGVRLTTMQVTFHRFVLAEFNTHRVFSRNSASSRAIPAAKMMKRIEEEEIEPLEWTSEQRGMRGGEPLIGRKGALARGAWAHACRAALMDAQELVELGVHKSVANRLLEPFASHTAVVTATAWQNFFEQRCSPLAQPEIRVAAEMMREAHEASKPQELVEGEWHLPYIESEDWSAMAGLTELGKSMYPEMVKVSAARCARVSYLTQDGKRDIQEDFNLYERLVSAKPAHWSPLEHVATPWPENRQETSHEGCPGLWMERPGLVAVQINTDHLPRVGNLLGWRSLRTEVEATLGARTYQ